jgi:hypothetical protein
MRRKKKEEEKKRKNNIKNSKRGINTKSQTKQ